MELGILGLVLITLGVLRVRRRGYVGKAAGASSAQRGVYRAYPSLCAAMALASVAVLPIPRVLVDCASIAAAVFFVTACTTAYFATPQFLIPKPLRNDRGLMTTWRDVVVLLLLCVLGAAVGLGLGFAGVPSWLADSLVILPFAVLLLLSGARYARR